MAATDFDKALLRAERISDPWYRCQALAAVARFAQEGDVVRVADKAVAAAMLGKDGYKRVAVAAWPVRALAERNKVPHAQRIIDRLYAEARCIEQPVSKMDALFLLWQAAWPLPTAVKLPALEALRSACHAANSWKAGRTLRDVALVVASEDAVQAHYIVNMMRDGVYKRQAQARLDAGQTQSVRAFFSPC